MLSSRTTKRAVRCIPCFLDRGCPRTGYSVRVAGNPKRLVKAIQRIQLAMYLFGSLADRGEIGLVLILVPGKVFRRVTSSYVVGYHGDILRLLSARVRSCVSVMEHRMPPNASSDVGSLDFGELPEGDGSEIPPPAVSREVPVDLVVDGVHVLEIHRLEK